MKILFSRNTYSNEDHLLNGTHECIVTFTLIVLFFYIDTDPLNMSYQEENNGKS